MKVRQDARKAERGGVLILCAFSMVVLLLFVGLAVDFGLAYMTKATLGKAVDAAALTGARYVGQGQTQSTAIAQTAFAMNYGHSSRDVGGNAPVPSVVFSKDSMQNTLIQVTATSTINTYFLALVPAYKTLNVTATAQARYARVQLTLVIDRTGSMVNNAPGTTLPDAINLFAEQFDNVQDTVAMVSFANDQTVDVPMMTGGFQSPVESAANGMPARFNGGTFSDGALQLAYTEEQKNMGLTGNIVHAVLFFTDGQANTIQTPLTCTGGGNLLSGTWNIGGMDPPNNNLIAFMSTDNTSYKGKNCPGKGNNVIAYPLNNTPPNGGSCASQNDGSSNACNGDFLSTVTGTMLKTTWANVNADALQRAVTDANTMRANNIIVYTIGLGADPQASFLCQVANDPCSSTYNPNLPVGEYVPAANASQLGAAFQEIANNIHLRLVQ